MSKFLVANDVREGGDTPGRKRPKSSARSAQTPDSPSSFSSSFLLRRESVSILLQVSIL